MPLRDLSTEPYGVLGLEGFITATREERARKGMITPAPVADVGRRVLAAAPPIVAYVNEGRWVADCPLCNGAEWVDLRDPRFFCQSCFNADAGGGFLPVEVPDPEERAEIDTALSRRPAGNQHWTRRETAADLRAENRAHGLEMGGPD